MFWLLYRMQLYNLTADPMDVTPAVFPTCFACSMPPLSPPMDALSRHVACLWMLQNATPVAGAYLTERPATKGCPSRCTPERVSSFFAPFLGIT